MTSRAPHASRTFLWHSLPLGVLTVLALLSTVGKGNPARLSLADSWALPSAAHWLGCAEGGIDVASFLGHAVLRVLGLSVCVALIGALIGVPLGAAAVLARGVLERWLLRACDLVQAFPTFLLALAVLTAVSIPTRLDLCWVFSLTTWASFARLTVVHARWLSDADFVIAARCLGASGTRLARAHVVPHLFGPVAVQIGTSAAGVVLGESALGFVGLGPSDGVSLGVLLEQGTVGMLRSPHVLLASAVAVAATMGALQLVSEGLRRWLLD